jgi:hypothetical protein
MIDLIHLNKAYNTENGLPVELYKQHDYAFYPIIGAIFDGMSWTPARWSIHGYSDVNIDWNLVEVPNFKPSFILERYTKLFDYFGLPLSIPDGILWLATDKDGTLYGYFNEPYCAGQGVWDNYDDEKVKIAKIQIIGDWKQSKIEVNFNK